MKTETIEKVKERPILFSTPMVQAILEGRKTVTRRVMDIQPNNPHTFGVSPIWGYGVPTGMRFQELANDEATVKDPWNYFCVHCATNENSKRVDKWVHCKFGKKGDILWVRETWRPFYKGSDTAPGYWNMFEFKAGGEKICPVEYEFRFDDYLVNGKWKPSIHMPRAACRLRLRIKSIGVERLHDITEEDAIREGIDSEELFINDYSEGKRYRDYFDETCEDVMEWFASPVDSFKSLWQSINGKESWDSNPWVWRIEFEKI